MQEEDWLSTGTSNFSSAPIALSEFGVVCDCGYADNIVEGLVQKGGLLLSQWSFLHPIWNYCSDPDFKL